MKITEIAKKANVSVATISRVINDDPKVKAATRRRVLEIIQANGYVPNNLGRNFRTQSTRTVLVVLPTIDNPFYSPIVHAIEDVARGEGYNVMLCNSYNSYDKLKEYSDYIHRKIADGMILLSPENGADYTFLNDFPAVVCCESQTAIDVPQIDIDHVRAGYEATKCLIGMGRKHIGFIGGSEKSASGVKREKGYRDAMKEAGLPIEPALVKNGFYDYKGGMAAARELLQEKDLDALFAISDELAIGFIAAAKAAGRKVPDEIAVMGFDDIEESQVFSPTLSTVVQPRYEMGKRAAEQIFKIFKGEETEPMQIIDHKLIVRQSTVKEEA